MIFEPEIPVRETLRLYGTLAIPKMDQPFSIYGIFTYKTGCFLGHMLVCIFQHHGSHMGIINLKSMDYKFNRFPLPSKVPTNYKVGL